MYGFPSDLDFHSLVGQFTTQICVGPYDLQFSLGDMRFIVTSPILLCRHGVEVGRWVGAGWPDASFYDVMNVAVVAVAMPDNRTLRLTFENGVEAILADVSDLHESMQIVVGRSRGKVYIV